MKEIGDMTSTTSSCGNCEHEPPKSVTTVYGGDPNMKGGTACVNCINGDNWKMKQSFIST